MNIKLIQDAYREHVPAEMRAKWLDMSAHPIQHGFNIYNSYRAGGKTTNQLIWSLIAFDYFGTTTVYVRSGSRATRAKAINTLCDGLNNIVGDDGLNYVQRITNNKYCWIMYHVHTKTFRLMSNLEDDLKTCPVFVYVVPVSESLALKSGFADVNADIIIYDEFIDDEVSQNTTIMFLNLISTVFRLRTKTVCFMNCNMSVGNPVVLRHFGIYEKILNQTTPFMVYHTKRGMSINVNVLETIEEHSNDRAKMNELYFNFDGDIEGIENIRGTSICHESYRELPPDTTGDMISETGLYIYSCGYWLNVQQVSNPLWQDMYYIKACIEPPHDSEHLTITDNRLFAFENPYCYASIGKDFAVCRDLAVKTRRNDICFDSFESYIYTKSFYDLYRIPEFI